MLISDSWALFEYREKAEKKRDKEPQSVVLQHLVIPPPLLFLSEKGFKMQ